MIEKWGLIWETVKSALGQQKAEVPDFFAPALTEAARLALVLLPLLTVILLVQTLLLAVAKKKKPRRILALAATFLVALGATAWAYAPQPLAKKGEASGVTLSTRVPGKAEWEVHLTESKKQALLALLEKTQCRRGTARELPGHAYYGEEFRLVYTDADGTQVHIWVSEGGGCRYTAQNKGLIYAITGYKAFYKALSGL